MVGWCCSVISSSALSLLVLASPGLFICAARCSCMAVRSIDLITWSLRCLSVWSLHVLPVLPSTVQRHAVKLVLELTDNSILPLGARMSTSLLAQ